MSGIKDKNGLKRRVLIFDKYSRDLEKTLKLLNVKIAYHNENGFSDFSTPPYICPLCTKGFTKDYVYHKDGLVPELTLEDNPPAHVGGKPSILTCFKCNNTKGKTDTSISTHIMSEDFLAAKNLSQIDARVQIKNYDFQSNIEIQKSKVPTIVFSLKSNEYGKRKLFNPDIPIDFSQIKFDFKAADPLTFYKSLLTIAHLECFKCFGYTYLLDYSGQQVLNAINGTADYPMINFGFAGSNFNKEFEGINVIKSPSEISSLLVVKKVVYREKVKFLGAIIPLSDKQGYSLLSNFSKYQNQKIDLQLEKLIFKTFPASPGGYSSL